MKNMILGITALLIATLFIAQGCNNANCDNVDCGEFGDCVALSESTICRCQSGYEKDNDELCTIKSSGRYLGNWAATETRFDNINFSQEILNYNVVISEDPNQDNRISFSNLGNLDNSLCGFADPIALLATVSVQNLSMVEATFCPAANFSGYTIGALTGRDTISDNADRIQLDFQLEFADNQGQKDFDCSVVLERQ